MEFEFPRFKPDYVRQPELRWEWWRFGLSPKEALALHDQYNTISLPILAPQAFHVDLAEMSSSAATVEELHARLAQRGRARRAEVLKSWRDTGTLLVAEPDWETDKSRLLAQLCNMTGEPSLDAILQFMFSHLPDDNHYAQQLAANDDGNVRLPSSPPMSPRKRRRCDDVSPPESPPAKRIMRDMDAKSTEQEQEGQEKMARKRASRKRSRSDNTPSNAPPDAPPSKKPRKEVVETASEWEITKEKDPIRRPGPAQEPRVPGSQPERETAISQPSPVADGHQPRGDYPSPKHSRHTSNVDQHRPQAEGHVQNCESADKPGSSSSDTEQADPAHPKEGEQEELMPRPECNQTFNYQPPLSPPISHESPGSEDRSFASSLGDST
ncbi:hypothetical protein DL764_000665 [Monosporascus ibericus]|uniref:Uncharacterized protein n=1 Tax=Monosporascus ibericus TaxID=155417 RepID=A0A4Q4TUE3_9PEZI|nr:hypothetical protein DL764_000665 [Monosporascus ibericus]